MKKIFSLLFVFAVSLSSAQEKIVKSTVNSATVFLNSAQVTRTKNVQLSKGIQTLKFTDLSPFVDKKSIQIKAANVEIQAINFQKDYLKKTKRSQEVTALESQIKKLQEQIDKEDINLTSAKEDINFLKSNREIGGKNQTLNVTTLRETSQFYSTQLKKLKLAELASNKKIEGLNDQVKKIRKQLKELTSKKEYAPGEIYVKVKSPSAKTIAMELTYNVSNVSWYPSYDVRVKDINSPLSLVYKANLKQNSQVDWKNVKLRFSSANPSQSTKAGKIRPYFLDYGTYPPSYRNDVDMVSGVVRDGGTNETLPGVNVMVKGTTIGTNTDFNGSFNLKIPSNDAVLVFSYLGFKTQERPVYGGFMNVRLQEEESRLDEVVVTAYGATKSKRKRDKKVEDVLQGFTPGVAIESNFDTSIPTKEIINQTSVSFEVIEPYTIKSSNKDFVVSLRDYQSDASYNYYAVPRIEENAFLVASLSDWERFNLLQGEANIYFEDTFIGTTLIDTQNTEKTLELSLGIDKNVQVKREKAKDFTTKQFIGNKQEENRIWNISVKNNKSQSIQMTVLDQIPISQREEIKVTLDKEFNGVLDAETGEVKWSFSLTPKATQKMQLKYSVRYPKNKRLVID
jgi:hypothetical protein